MRFPLVVATLVVSTSAVDCPEICQLVC